MNRVKLTLLLVASLLTSSCLPGPPMAKWPTLRIASYDWPGSFWIDVAWKKGWFVEAGLNIERFDAHHHYFESLDAVVKGQIDVMGFTQFDLVKYVANGEDLVGIAAIDYSEGAEALVAHAGIKHLRDLQGKRLGLPRGTYLEYLLSVIAEREGLDLAGITLIDSPQGQSYDDFLAGRLDAIFVWEPYVTEAVAGGAELLFSSADFPGLTYSVLALRRSYIDLHPEQIAALLRVWHRAEQFVRDNPEESCVIVAGVYHEPLDSVRNLMQRVRVLDLADNGRAYSYAAGFESLHASWRRMNDFMLERGLVGRRVESQPHLDTDFLRQLE